MSYFDRKSGMDARKGGKSFGGPPPWKRGFGDKGGARSMHAATCSQCGDRCEVPFKPNGKKPIFCSNCFVKDEDTGSKRFSGPRSSSPRFGEKRSFEGGVAGGDKYADQLREINSKLDAILRALDV